MIAIIKEREKADSFQKKFGGKIFSGYRSLLESEEIDAVYLPLPPALHCEWGIRTLEHGKHLLVEKPSTTNVRDTKRLVKTASNDGLALHENYMFQYHTQLEEIQKKLLPENWEKFGHISCPLAFRIGVWMTFVIARQWEAEPCWTAEAIR